MRKEEVAGIIDHTILKMDVDYASVKLVCMEAIRFNFAAVVVFPLHIPLCVKLLEDSNVKICAALTWPWGSRTKEIKAFEAIDAISKGADECEVVVNIGALRQKRYDVVEEELVLFRKATHEKIAKVIIETCFLTDEEKVKVCEIAKGIGVDIINTSTDFYSPPTIEDVKLIKEVVGDSLGVKASGSINNAKQAKLMIEAGATRIGTSYGVEIVEGWVEDFPLVKKVITEQEILKANKEGVRNIFLYRGDILTPAASDLARASGIAIFCEGKRLF